MARSARYFALSILACMGLGAQPAHATLTLPAASITDYFTTYSSNTYTFYHTIFQSLGGATAAIDEAGVSVTAMSSATTASTAALGFSIAIYGPAGVTSVPLDLGYTYQATASTDPTANPSGNPSAVIAGLSYSGFADNGLINNNTQDTGSVVQGSIESFSLTALKTFTVPTNTKLLLGIQVGANGAGGMAFMSETVAIDPSFFMANPQYAASDITFDFSSGVDVGTPVSVQEPTTLLLLLAPILALGLSATYRRRAGLV